MKSKSRFALHRRRFLQAAGLVGSSFFLPSAHSAPGDGPRRVIFLLNNQGWVRSKWAMKPPGAPSNLSENADPHGPDTNNLVDNDEWEFDFGGMTEDELSVGLKPLHRHLGRTLALDGLTLAYNTSMDEYGDGHAKGWCASLTGNVSAYAITGQKSYAKSPSIDQLIAKHLRANDAALTDLVSLEYTLSSSFPFHHYIYGERPDGSAVKLPAETNPAKAFDRLFPGSGGTDPVADRQLAVTDAVAGRYESLQARLSGEDKAKLQLHRDLVRDVQKRLETLATLQCTQPVRYDEPDGASKGEKWLAEFDAFSTLAVTAMSCGLTRVATIQFGDTPVDLIDGSGDLHHDYAHPSDPDNEFKPDTFDAWNEGHRVMTNAMVRQTELAAQLADKLDAIPEGNGTMLDNTLIVMLNELSHGGHGHDQYPVVMIGGFGGAFRMGRYIRWPRNNPNPFDRNWGRQYYGKPHVHLLTSICNAMGLSVDNLGLESVQGAVKTGDPRPSGTIDMTGPLDRLS